MPVTIGAKLDSDFRDPLGLLGDCHRRIERFLGTILAVARRAGGKPLDDEQRRALDAALHYFREAAPRHVADEEESLFPRLRKTGDLSSKNAMDRLERDHAAVQDWHQELDVLGRTWLRPEGRLETVDFQRFVALANSLHGAYGPHIAVEDDQVFPRAGLF